MESDSTLFQGLGARKRPRTVSPLPGPRAAQFLKAQQKYESTGVTYPGLFPLVPARAEGEWIEDVDGNVFLDMTSMAGVLNLGHSPQHVKTFTDTATCLMTTLDFPSIPRIAFLASFTDTLRHVFSGEICIHMTSPSGADAVEAALKLCRWNKPGGIVAAYKGSYHGMSAGAAAMSDLPKQPRLSPPLSEPTPFLPYPFCFRRPLNLRRESCNVACLDEVKHLLERLANRGERLGGVIIEPIQGEGGSVPAPREYMRGLSEFSPIQEPSSLSMRSSLASGGPVRHLRANSQKSSLIYWCFLKP